MKSLRRFLWLRPASSCLSLLNPTQLHCVREAVVRRRDGARERGRGAGLAAVGSRGSILAPRSWRHPALSGTPYAVAVSTGGGGGAEEEVFDLADKANLKRKAQSTITQLLAGRNKELLLVNGKSNTQHEDDLKT